MIDPAVITLASLLTAAGALIAATIVTLLVDVLKVPFPNLNGLIATFVASLILYVIVFFDSGILTLGELFLVFLSWLACAAAAFGLHKSVLAGVSESIGKLERQT